MTVKPYIVNIASATVTVVIILIGLAVLFFVFRRRIIRIREIRTEAETNKNILQTGAIVRLPGILLRQGSDLFGTLTTKDSKTKVKPKFVPCLENPGQLKVVYLPGDIDDNDPRKNSLRNSTAQFTRHSTVASMSLPDYENRDLDYSSEMLDEVRGTKFTNGTQNGVPRRLNNNLTS